MKIKIPNKYLVGRDFNGNIKNFSFDAESIKETSEKLSIMTDSIQNIMNEVRLALANIAEATQNTAANSGSVMDSVDLLSNTVSDINDMADQQNNISSELSEVVSKFKLNN